MAIKLILSESKGDHQKCIIEIGEKGPVLTPAAVTSAPYATVGPTAGCHCQADCRMPLSGTQPHATGCSTVVYDGSQTVVAGLRPPLDFKDSRG